MNSSGCIQGRGLSFKPRFHWADDVISFDTTTPVLDQQIFWLNPSIYCGFPLITWVAGTGRFHLLQFSIYVPTHVVTLTQVGSSVYLGQTHLGTPFQVPAWVIKFSFGSTGDEISSLIIIQCLFAQQKFEY